ncbi:hypothetical protein CG723_25810 [Streptomyces sp. CB01635]|uniref:hypothetical protein n=1 Tax=unclassified Streptomyces TaxID=2593676 RepID=UPI000C27064E|nr:hypothetical protein [Streptomyces sp. CB01635]PJN08906.1 hypothetical protein CG723_25810 [Streptomyces sp. CB01635]
MLMLQKVVIAAATVGGLVALGSGSAYAANYSDSGHGGTRPFVAVGLSGDVTPQAQQPAEKKREALEKKASKGVNRTAAWQANARTRDILRTVGLPDGLLELPRQLAGTAGGKNQNNQVNGASGGVNQNNQAISASGGVNQNNQAISASGGVNQNNQVNGSSGGVNQNNQANGASGGVNQNNQANGSSGGVNQNNQANGSSGGVNQNNQANGASGGVNQNNQANGASGGVNQNNQVNGPRIAFAPAIQQLDLKQAQTVSGN